MLLVESTWRCAREVGEAQEAREALERRTQPEKQMETNLQIRALNLASTSAPVTDDGYLSIIVQIAVSPSVNIFSISIIYIGQLKSSLKKIRLLCNFSNALIVCDHTCSD